MKKLLASLLSIVCLAALATGCKFTSSMTYTFSIDNGDSIKVAMDTTGKYKITPEVPFTISHDGEELLEGSFIHGAAYEKYKEAVDQDERAELLDSGTKDGNEYLFWCFDNKAYNYAIMVNGSNTGVLLEGAESEEIANECFNRLTISKAE